MTGKDDKGDQPSGGETTWTNTGETRCGRGQHKTGSFGDGMLRPSPNSGTQRLPNDDDDDDYSNVCCACPNMGDKGSPALILDSTYMQNCPPCYCPSCYHRSGNTTDILLIPSCWTNMWNDNYMWTTEWSAQSEQANATAAEFVSLCYNCVRRVTVRLPCYPSVCRGTVIVTFSDFIHLFNL